MPGLETVMGAELICTTGSGTSTLMPDPIPIFVEGFIAGTIIDGVADVNIPALDSCDILGMCVPLTAVWIAGNPTVLMDGIPALAQISICPCLAAVALAVATGGADDVGPCVVLVAEPNNFTVFV